MSDKVEQELLYAAERLETLRRIESGILQAESTQAIADLALRQIERIVPSTSALISLLQSPYLEAIILASRNTKMKRGDAVPTAGDRIEALKRDQALIVDDVTALPKKTAGQKVALKSGARSTLSAPLLIHGELIGVITLLDANPRAFSEQDVQITRQIGNSIAIAIHNSQLLESEKKARREAETMREVAASLNTSLGQEELLDLILAQLEHVLPYDGATILLQKEDKLVVAAHRGQELQVPDSFPTSGETPPNILKIAREQQPLLISDTNLEPTWINLPGGEFIQCWLGAPLVAKDTFIGLLMLDKQEPHFYTEQDKDVVLAFANQAAAAIENAKLYHESQQYAELLERRVIERTLELGALYKITAISSQHLVLQETLERIIEVISVALDCRTVTIQIVDESTGTVRLACHLGLSPQVADYIEELPVETNFITTIMQSDHPYVLKEPQADPSLSDVPLAKASTYSVGTAIRSKGTILGILGIAIHRPQPLTGEHIALLTSIADHIGVAIENDRLRRQSEQLAVLQERDRLARDLHDTATQSLFSLTLFAAAAREHLGSGHFESVQEQLDELEETAVQTHKEMRLLLYKLRPLELEVVGLADALRRRMQMVEVRSGIQGHINSELSSILPVMVEQTLYHVANEALNNTLKHSGADSVTINITEDSSFVRMDIIDNGRGFAVDDANFTAGMGLDNMAKRVADMGGAFHYESKPKTGTTIVVEIPLVFEEAPQVV